jgi:hypothetical protein
VDYSLLIVESIAEVLVKEKRPEAISAAVLPVIFIPR